MQTTEQLSADPVRKRVLSRLAVLLLFVGLGFAAVPFLESMKPGAKARANVPTFSASEIPVGSYNAIEFANSALIVVQPVEGEFTIFWTWRWRGSGTGYILRPGYIECRELAITEKTIRCEGPDYPSPEWTFDGQPAPNSPPWIPELELLPYALVGDVVRYGRGA